MPMEISHIWLGRFSSEGDARAYFAEHYNDGDDNDEDGETPISQFAADQGQWFYDHDWLEVSFQESRDLRALVMQHSFSSDYLEEILSRANSLGLAEQANTFVLADKAEFNHPRSVKTEQYQLWYFGEFSCTIL
jgi:hypothetical protein